MIDKRISHYTIVLLCCVAANVHAQSVTAYPSLTYPHSVTAGGMGEQGAAMRDAQNALQYNPANLVSISQTSISFFRNPWMISFGHAPLTTQTVALRFDNGAAAGVEYTEWKFGYLPYTADYWSSDIWGARSHPYEQSIAGAFAIPLGSEWAAGVHLRYATSIDDNNVESHDLLFGAGVSYLPAALDQRASLGFSIMNLGNPTRTLHSDFANQGQTESMPAQINLAGLYTLVRHPLWDVKFGLGFTKSLAEKETKEQLINNYIYFTSNGVSSFKSMFTEWGNFPRDVTTHLGLTIAWKPVPLGAGVSFFQEMSVGYFTGGVGSDYVGSMTHGIRAGFEAYGVKASAGYAGRWHNFADPEYFQDSPWETFEFTLSTNFNTPPPADGSASQATRPHAIIVSGGYASCNHNGRTMQQYHLSGAIIDFSPASRWSVETDIYLNDRSAIIASLGYMHADGTIKLPGYVYQRYLPSNGNAEMLAFSSGFRYHPIADRQPFYAQAALGMMWINPLWEYADRRYQYNTFGDLSFGMVIPVVRTGIVLMPNLGVKTVLMKIPNSLTALGGYNQVEYGLNIGYAFD